MRKHFLLLPLLFFTAVAWAGNPEDSVDQLVEQLKRIDSIEKSLHYKTGTVTIGDNLTTINVAKGFKFLEAKEAAYIVQDIWGNPKGEEILGMLMPDSMSAPIADYAFIVQYSALGYVKDGDADKIDYAELLADMKKENIEGNKEREKLGLQTLNLMGWAKPPSYDKERKILYWAKEYQVPGEEDNTLNYDVRILGRKGVLVMQAVGSMSELKHVQQSIDPMLGMVSFNQGSRYSDFDSSTDEVAAWTIGGLVAGKVLAKAGILALILKNIKLVILAIVGFGGAIWKWITGRKKEDEVVVDEGVVEPNQAT